MGLPHEDMTTRIWYHRETGKSDYRIELETIKEYLCAQEQKMYKEIGDEEDNAEKKGIPSYLINIFTKVLSDRRKLITNLLHEVIGKVNDDNDKNKLFEFLISFGFIKTENKETIFFTKGDATYTYPQTPLVRHHYEATCEILDANGLMKEAVFNRNFNLNRYAK